ncbi:MAG: helix-turn-helix domain-containing protein [Flavobacterium sp.]|nr:helix-turn-helix domain-containing protein [Flavobacterium sp.]
MIKLFTFKKTKFVDLDLQTLTEIKKKKFLGVPYSTKKETNNIKIVKENMKHNIKIKTKVLNLLNEGLNVKEVSIQTKVTEKTIAKWVRKWRENDKPKQEILTTLWDKLSEQSKNDKLNAAEIKAITQSIQKLHGELSIFGKYINL